MYKLRVITGGYEWDKNAECEANTVPELQILASNMVTRNPKLIGETYSIAKITGSIDHQYATTVKTGIIEGQTK